jgi:hypothetical protein
MHQLRPCLFGLELLKKAIWWLVEKLAGGILTLAFVIYVLLLCTPKD